MKICSNCNIEKLFDLFPLRNGIPNGSICKLCKNEKLKNKRIEKKIEKIEKIKEENEIKQELKIENNNSEIKIIDSDIKICNSCDKAILSIHYPKTKDGKIKGKKCQECLNKEMRDRRNEIEQKELTDEIHYYKIPHYVNYKCRDSIFKYVHEIDDYLFKIKNNNKIIMDNFLDNERYRNLIGERNNEIIKCMKNLTMTKDVISGTEMEYEKTFENTVVTENINSVKNNEVNSVDNNDKKVVDKSLVLRCLMCIKLNLHVMYFFPHNKRLYKSRKRFYIFQQSLFQTI